MSDFKKIRISRRLSKILRHEALEYKLNIAEDGYVKVNELFNLHEMQGLDLEILKDIVSNNPKNRFTLKYQDNDWYIRANQGHSIHAVKSDKLLQPIMLPCSCIHATNWKALHSIQSNGLNKMSRNTIHFSEKYPAEYISKDKVIVTHIQPKLRYEVLIHIDMKKAMDDGIRFWKSENGVILTEGVKGILDPKYFIKITKVNGDIIN